MEVSTVRKQRRTLGSDRVHRLNQQMAVIGVQKNLRAVIGVRRTDSQLP